jgi:diguanylate cyclase (GGDEF)-like protein
LLRRFVPNPDDGFAAYLRLYPLPGVVRHSRGLSEASRRTLVLDAEILELLRLDKTIVLESHALLNSRLLRSLSPDDRNKVRQLFLVAVEKDDELIGIFLATRLIPTGAPQQQQLELALRLMRSVGSNLHREQELEEHQQQLQMTSDMLAIRSIADRRFETPVAMVQEFLQQLLAKLDTDRAALYLGQPGAALASIPLVSCGMTLQPGVREQWQRHEELLAKAGQGLGQLETFDSEQLARLQIRSLMGSALAIPLLQQRHNTIGVLCLTRQDRKPFTADQQKLAAWSVEFLAEKILVAANHAVVERQARLDGLTQLANRRTFDLQIQRELKHALATGGHCALVLLDLDRFKSINDRYGHLAGDLVLRTAAQIVRDSMGKIRACDRALCARYGGEELAVLLPGLNLNAAARVAESIRQSLEAKVIDHEGLTLRVTLSAGVADCPQHAGSVEELISAADTALYQAKASGRNRVGAPVATPV